MADVRHTPGPWHQAPIVKYADIHSEIVSHIARVPIRDTVGRANARLIAAAPNLLEIVRLVDQNVSGGEPCPFCSTSPHRADCGLAQTLQQIDGATTPE